MLNAIKLETVKQRPARAAMTGLTVRIWSREHQCFWRPNAQGYTAKPDEAWTVDFTTAYKHTKHAGPEKGIEFVPVAPDYQI